MSDAEHDQLAYDLVVVLLPRLTTAQLKRLHASAARMATTTAWRDEESDVSTHLRETRDAV